MVAKKGRGSNEGKSDYEMPNSEIRIPESITNARMKNEETAGLLFSSFGHSSFVIDSGFGIRNSGFSPPRLSFFPCRPYFPSLMNWLLLALLSVACPIMMLIERSGVRTTLVLNFKGDVKRETRWIAQYGQAVCTVIAAVLVVQLDPRGKKIVVPLLVATFGVSVVATVIKRLVGRVRPARENAGKFLGPSLKHANFRESFPSSHSASAVAMSAVLAHYYPPAAVTFWALAILCAMLRYVLDAHWPSDVLGGVALGYAAAALACQMFTIT
jgi:membrane-associated phospholipid phosphatase